MWHTCYIQLTPLACLTQVMQCNRKHDHSTGGVWFMQQLFHQMRRHWQFLDKNLKQFLVICLPEHWVRVPAGPLYAWGRKKKLSHFCPHPNCRRSFWSSALSYFTHIHPVVTTMKLMVKIISFGVSFGVLFTLTNLGFSLRDRHLGLFGCASCGCFVPTENLSLNYKNYVMFLCWNWPVNESRISFVVLLVTGEDICRRCHPGKWDM